MAISRSSSPSTRQCPNPRCKYIGTTIGRTKRHSLAQHFECGYCRPGGELYTNHFQTAHRRAVHLKELQDGIRPARQPKQLITIPRLYDPCRFTPRCSFISQAVHRSNHSASRHLKCPVPGCTVLGTKTLFVKHVTEDHEHIYFAHCQYEGCTRGRIRLTKYWIHYVNDHPDWWATLSAELNAEMSTSAGEGE